jgi:hypothetical protein
LSTKKERCSKDWPWGLFVDWLSKASEKEVEEVRPGGRVNPIDNLLVDKETIVHGIYNLFNQRRLARYLFSNVAKSLWSRHGIAGYLSGFHSAWRPGDKR